MPFLAGIRLVDNVGYKGGPILYRKSKVILFVFPALLTFDILLPAVLTTRTKLNDPIQY